MSHTQAVPIRDPEKSKIQGLILRGYTHPCSAHMLFKFDNVAGVPAFFRALMPHLQSAESWGSAKPAMMLNIGLTWPGTSLLFPAFDPTNFPGSFVVGPDCPLGSSNRADPQASLIDTGASDPAGWWNGKFKTEEIHCVVHAYATNYDNQATIVNAIVEAAKKNGITELKPMKTEPGRLEQYPFLPNNYVHFDYRDSIDEPDLELGPIMSPPTSYESYLSNFLIGYAVNEYTIPFPNTGDEGNLAINGCYNAFRVLQQDVVKFDAFLDQNTPSVAERLGKPDDYAREWLAAKLNGRWRNGSPLVISPDMPDEKTVKNTQFGFEKNGDSMGFKCPFSAHTRVSNPRDQPLSGVSITAGVPRLIRRGVPYGPPPPSK